MEVNNERGNADVKYQWKGMTPHSLLLFNIVLK